MHMSQPPAIGRGSMATASGRKISDKSPILSTGDEHMPRYALMQGDNWWANERASGTWNLLPARCKPEGLRFVGGSVGARLTTIWGY